MDFFTAVVLIVLIVVIGGALRGRGSDRGRLSARVAEQDAEIQRLQQQITELRETTTRYDVSFDSALQRLERRIAEVEAARSPAADRVRNLP
jgi:uncharacterized coiled-coil protein SlyX